MKYSIKLRVVILLIVINSCTSKIPQQFNLNKGNIPLNSNANCNDIYSKINQSWASNGNFPQIKYWYNKELIKEIKNDSDCFVGLTVNDVKNLLGKPNTEDKIMSYSLYSKKRNSKNIILSHVLYFYYSNNETDKIIERINIEKIYLVE